MYRFLLLLVLLISTVPQNVASMKNNGFEVQLGYNDREGDFKWNASANLSIITNKVLKLGRRCYEY